MCIVTSKGFLNSGIYTPTRFYWLILVQCFMQFQACSIYILSILIRSIFNSATSCLSKFARAVLYSYAIAICHLLILILVPFLVSFNVYATPSFSQLCSLSVFFFLYVLYFSIQVRLLSHTLVLKFITLTSSTSSYYFLIF